MEDTTSIITIIGAVAAVIAAIVGIATYIQNIFASKKKKTNEYENITLEAFVNHPFDKIEILMVNPSKSNIRIKELIISCEDAYYKKPFYRENINVLLIQGDTYILQIGKEQIITSLNDAKVRNEYYSLLYVDIISVTNKKYAAIVYIDDSIQGERRPGDDNLSLTVSTDLFLGKAPKYKNLFNEYNSLK